jgi:Domain of unknown function (DUF4136)
VTTGIYTSEVQHLISDIFPITFVIMQKTLFFSIFTLLSGLLFAFCATPEKTVSVTQDKEADFRALRTYNWLPDGGDSLNNLSIFDNQILRGRMRRAIELELKTRGMQATEGAADVLFQLVVRNKGQVGTQTRNNNTNNSIYGRYPYNNNYPTTTTSTPTFFERHEVLINAFDRKQNLIWACSSVNNYRDADHLQKDIEPDMARIMAQYPVKTAKKK